MSVKLTSILIVVLLIGILIFAGPASAVLSLGLDSSSNSVYRGENLVFNAQVEVDSNQNLEIDRLFLELRKGIFSQVCEFLVDGTLVSGCENLDIDLLESTEFVYGYKYEEGRFLYKITLDSSSYELGHYQTSLKVELEDGSFETIEGFEFDILNEGYWDVAYVYSSQWHLDENVLNKFSEKGLSVHEIRCDEVGFVDFSRYDMIFVGDEYLPCANKIPVDEKASVVMNSWNLKDLGLSGKRGFSAMSSNLPVKTSDEMFKAYTQEHERLKNVLIIYALESYNGSSFEKIAEKWMSPQVDLGAAVAYVHPGSSLVDGKVAEENICFFGLVESDYWTDESEDLFGECVDFVLGEDA